LQARPIGLAEVRAAFADASTTAVVEGVVGAGTGTSCFGWKGGIGTASRLLPEEAGEYVVGALVQTNYGRADELTICGVPVGQHIVPPKPDKRLEDGSIMMVLATNAPFDTRQLGRLCQRAAFGLARTGSTCHGGSGDFVIAFSTANRIPDRPQALAVELSGFYEQPVLSLFSLAVIEAVEEAIYNSMFMAHTVVGRDGNSRFGLPVANVVELVQKYGRYNG
jgi:D-aminopeptidase